MNTVFPKTNFIRLPKGFTARGANFEDVEQSCRLMNRWTRSTLGLEEKENSEAILREWKSPDFDPASDIRLVFAPTMNWLATSKSGRRSSRLSIREYGVAWIRSTKGWALARGC
jgi:hypothetical protein